jgi:hypothetical protein
MEMAWSVFTGLFMAVVGIIIKIVMGRLDNNEKAIHGVSDKMIALETICSKCPIEAVEACQNALKNRVSTLEADWRNITSAVYEIKDIVQSLNKKIDDIKFYKHNGDK